MSNSASWNNNYYNKKTLSAMKWWKHSWAKSLTLINSLSLNNSNCNTIYIVVILKVLTYSELNYPNFCFWETDWLIKLTNGQFKECSGIKMSYVTYCWLTQTSLPQNHFDSSKNIFTVMHLQWGKAFLTDLKDKMCTFCFCWSGTLLQKL